MRWSIEELLWALKIYKEYRFLTWLKRLPRNTYRRTKLFFKWVFTGRTDQVLWNLDTYLETVIISKLKDFRKQNLSGYSCDLESMQDWLNVIDEMIDTWEKMHSEYYINLIEEVPSVTKDIMIKGISVKSVSFPRTEEQMQNFHELVKKQNENDLRALELFSKYFHALWD